MHIILQLLFKDKRLNMVLNILLLVAGLALLIFGADRLVEGATSIAKRMGISDLAIGLTVVSFGTSAPEFVVNTIAAWQDKPDIVFGNVIGSNNFNLFIILGITGIIVPLKVQASTVWKEIPLSLFAIAVLLVLTNLQLYDTKAFLLGRIDATILLVIFAAFLYYVYKQLNHENSEVSPADNKALWVHWLTVMVGLAGLVIGGRLVVINAVNIAELMGLSEKVIGLTIVAAGTSLPELATSVVAAIKKNNDIAVGNIIGSNIFNLFFILGVSAMVRPIAFNPSFNTDLVILSLGTIFLFAAMFLSGKRKLDRWEAFVLLTGYVAYTIWLI